MYRFKSFDYQKLPDNKCSVYLLTESILYQHWYIYFVICKRNVRMLMNSLLGHRIFTKSVPIGSSALLLGIVTCLSGKDVRSRSDEVRTGLLRVSQERERAA